MADTLRCASLSDVQATDLLSVMMVFYDGETIILNPRDPWPKFIESREKMNAMLGRIDRDAMRVAKAGGAR